MKYIYYLTFVFLSVIFSCSKEKDIEDFFSDEKKDFGLVIDGFIINGLDIPPTVRLTHAEGILETLNNGLINKPILGATVYITSSKDNYKENIILSELVLDNFINSNAITIPSEERRNFELLGYYAFTGNMATLDIQSGYTYRLTVEVDGKTYIAEDRMPIVEKNTTPPLFTPPFGLEFTNSNKTNFYIQKHHFGFEVSDFYMTEVNLIKDIDNVNYFINDNTSSYSFDFSNANTWTSKLNGFMLFNSLSRDNLANNVYLSNMKTIYIHPNIIIEGSFPLQSSNSAITLTNNLFNITKFSMSDNYYNYKKDIFRETEWRSLFSTPPSNVEGNIEGAYGFFFASEAVTEKFDSQTFLEKK